MCKTGFKMRLISIVIGSLTLIEACKTQEEPKPEVDFALNTMLIAEGDTVVFQNKSLHSKSFLWRMDSLKYSSNETAPSYIFKQAGNFE